MPDLQAQIAALRADGHKLRAFVSFYVGQEVAEFEADTIYVDSDYPLTSISGAYNSGSEADVKEGFLVEIRRSAGQLRRVTRTRYGATQTSTALKIRELSRAESVTGNSDLLIIRREVRISDKLVEATADFNPDGIAVGTFNSNPPPIANSGGLDVGFVDSGQTYRSVPFFGSLSFTVDPDSAGTVTHVWTIPTGGGAFAPGSASTDANPTIRVNVGHWLIQHAVTDSSNSVTTTQYIMVIVHDTTSATPYECVLEPLEGGKEDGWNYRVQIFEDALETDIPYGSYAIVWVDETINGTTQSFGSPVTGRSHIKAVGIIQSEETREDGRGADTLTFDIISPLAQLGKTPGFSKVMERNASPDAWAEIADLKTLRASLQLIQFYCNINQAGFDVIVDAEMPSYDYPLLFLQKDSPLGQIRELTSATQGQFICDRRGRFMFIPVLNLLTRTARDNRTTALVFSRDDIIDIQVSQEHWRPIETFRLKGFSAHSTTPNPVFAKYPGDAPGQGNQSGSVERIICQNTATAYFFCGLYGAMEDGWFTTGTGIGYFAPRVTITVPGSYDVLDFYGEWIELDFSLRLRGTDLSAFRYELVRATVTYDGGTANCVFELQAETFGEPGVDDTPAQSDTNLTDWTDIWGDISFDILPYDPFTSGSGIIAMFLTSNEVAITFNFFDSPPTWSLYSLTLNGTLDDFVPDPFSPKYLGTGTAVNGWIATSTRIYRITDIFGARTLASQHTFAVATSGGVSQRIVETERNLQNFVVCVTGYEATTHGVNQGVKAIISTNGSTWGSETALTANGHSGIYASPGLYVSNKVAGTAFTAAVNGSADFDGYRYNGSTWGTTTDPLITGDQLPGAIHFPFHDNASEDIAYYGSHSNATPAVCKVYRANGGSKDDVTPTFTAVEYTPRFPRSIASCDVNRQFVALCGHQTPSVGSSPAVVAVSEDAGDTWTKIYGEAAFPSRYLSVRWGGNNLRDLYLLGDTDIAYVTNFGAPVSKLGALVTSGRPVNIAGG